MNTGILSASLREYSTEVSLALLCHVSLMPRHWDTKNPAVGARIIDTRDFSLGLAGHAGGRNSRMSEYRYDRYTLVGRSIALPGIYVIQRQLDWPLSRPRRCLRPRLATWLVDNPVIFSYLSNTVDCSNLDRVKRDRESISSEAF